MGLNMFTQNNPLVAPPIQPYLCTQLITRAWNLSGIVAKGFETVSGGEGETGLFLLNELLALKAADTGLIPYYQRIQFPLVQDQEKYFIPNLLEIETFTFNIGDVRFPTARASRHHYFGDGRVDSIQSLPFEWHYEREEGGGMLYVYYLPDSNYVAKITGKFGLTNVQFQTDLASVYDGFYIGYLRYCLARYMDQEYDVELSPDKLKVLKEIEHKLKWVSPPDLSQRKISFMNKREGYNWARVNISPSWNIS